MSAIQHLKNSELKPLAMSQTISFEDAQDGSSFDVYAKEVLVQSSAGSHTTGSSKVKLKSIVDYGWESRHYPGRLVAVHMGGKYLAYGLKPVGKSVGVVRVVNRETEERALIRDLLGLVSDLCFAHIRSEIMLASVDHFGNLFVHHIEQGSNGSLDCNLILHLEHEGTQIGSALSHRVVWCPYIPEDAGSSSGDTATDEDDAAKLLVAIHGAKAEMLNVARVRGSIPSAEVRVRPSLVSEGRLSMEAHSGDIVEASFSPDGTALATASTDGLVKFFLVYLPDKAKPRCLHEWCPHGGNPLSCLFFLDDHRNPSPEVQFWKYVVTGTRNNHELKLWSCESWTCLQTIYFGDKEAPIGQEEGFLKAGLDLSAKFLLLSDIARKVLYVLQFGRDVGIPFVTSISEFCLPYPILSFGVVDAEICFNKRSSLSPSAAYPDDPSDDVNMEEGKDDSEESGNRRPAVEGEEAIQNDETVEGGSTVIIQIVLVQPKSLQECHIMFKSGSSNSVQGNLLSMEASDGESKVAEDHQSVVDTVNISADAVSCFPGKAPILTLMTPDAFSSPIRREPSSLMTGGESEEGTQEESCVGAVGSGGSSPSREVQQIFSLSDSPRGVEFFEEKEEGAIERPVDEEDAILPLTDQLDKVVVVVSQGERENTSKASLPELHSVAVDNETNVETGVRQEGDGAGIGADGRRGSGLSSLILEVGSLARAVRAQNESFQRFRSEVKSEISLLRDECHWGGEGSSHMATLIESSLRPQLERCVSQAMERVGPLIEVTLEEHRRELGLQHEKFLREGPSVCWDAIVRSAVATGLEPLRQQLCSEAATQAETAAREGVSMALQKNSKMLVDNIANGLLVTLRPAMLEVFRQAFSALVLPSFEKSCSHMFQQINDAFSHGTKEYGRAMESHFERRWNTEKSKEAAALESVRNEARQLAEAIQKDVPVQIHKLSSTLRDSLAQEVRSALEEPLSRGLREQKEWLEGNFSKSLQTIMFSPARVAPVGTDGAKRGPTPTSSPSGVSPNGAILMRSRFSELLTQGRLNEAFQMALSASDLGLVTYLCELTTPAQVFGGKCKLEQPVLLSLVQQLSANLFDRTELKMGYLMEAVLYLDVHQPELKEHLTMVLGVLQKGLNSYLASRPGSCLAKEMTMLLRMSACLMDFAKCKSVSYSYRADSATVPLME